MNDAWRKYQERMKEERLKRKTEVFNQFLLFQVNEEQKQPLKILYKIDALKNSCS